MKIIHQIWLKPTNKALYDIFDEKAKAPYE